MATLVSFVDFDITQLDLNFYDRHDFLSELGDNQNAVFNGVTYADEFVISADDGTFELGLFLLGSGFAVDGTNALTVGTVNAIAEGELTTQSLLWYAQGISLGAAAIRDAAATLTSDDEALLFAQALAGDDTIVLSPFDDLIATFGGNDTITGNAGDDVIDGGEGSDIAIYTQGIEGVTALFEGSTVFLTVPGAGTDQLTNVEFVQFSSGVRSVASLSDLVKPQVSSSDPADGATGVAAAQTISITFSEAIAKGAGAITLREFRANGTAIATFDAATSAALSVSGSVLTINPPADLEPGIRYFVVIPKGAVIDTAGNVFDGTTTYDFTVFGNAPAFTAGTLSLAAVEDVALPFQAPASDPDGGPLTYAPSGAQKGTVTRAADGTFTYTPFANATGSDSFTLTVTDRGGLSDTLPVSVTIAAVQDAPLAPPTRMFFVTTGTPAAFSTGATDADGDVLTYTMTPAAHGTVTPGTGDSFSYAANAGYSGTDSVVVTIDDQHGGVATQTVNFLVQPEFTDNWRMFTQSGLVAQIGGSGLVFGSTGFEDMTVFDLPGLVTFDASYNRGNDIVRLGGNVEGWLALTSGSNVFFSDGDTNVILPIGTSGIALVFDDGVRVLKYEQATGLVKLGDQALSQTAGALESPPGDPALPTGALETAGARLFLSSPGEQAAQVTLGGKLQIFGTNNPDEITLLAGDITLDGSFNRGGDRIVMGDPAEDFTARVSGSNAELSGGTLHAIIPVGLAETTLAFTGGDERVLIFDTVAGAVMLGDQQLGGIAVALTPFG